MPRPRTPTAILELKGSFKKNPDRGRARADEPVVTTVLGPPPVHLTAPQMQCWSELQSMTAAGVLILSDRWTAEVASVLMSEFRTGNISGAKLAILNQLLSKMGLTPADRSRISVPKQPEEQDEFAKFLQ